MIKKILRWTLYLSVSLAVLVALVIAGFTHVVRQGLVPPADPAGQPSIASYAIGEPEPQGEGAAHLVGLFSWEAIATPPKSARPWTRWWWPGGAVDPAVLQQQLEQLDAANFGGAEIQASAMGIAAVTDESALTAVYSFDTPSFYHKLDSLMQTVEELGWQVDLTHLSGWPPGGPQINLEDSLTELAYGETSVVVKPDGTALELALPEPAPPANKYALAAFEPFMGDFVNFAANHAQLLSVLAVQKTGGQHAWNPLNLNDTETLDAATAVVLTDKVRDGKLHWQAPAGEWAIIASYLLPSGEVPINGAQSPKGYVVDHLRQPQVRGHYEYAFGQRTGLPKHYGKGVRGFFNDSLEFRLNRMSSPDILTEFKSRRGYDLAPLLPAIYVTGADDLYFSEVFGVHAAPEFRLTDMDDRIRYDYSRTLSDLMIERFIATSANWAEARGLISRGQSYGVDLDMLRAMGANTIPETEQLQGGGSNLSLKMASSAAALYGKPLVSAESFVWRGYDYSSTARKLKAAADKLLLAGINHIVYHGTPYPWSGGEPGPFGPEGWSPFSGVENPGHFSSIVSPANTSLWPDIGQLNQYMARSQNLLRQGSSSVDVLIYYPFLGYRSGEENTHEPLVNGELPDYDATTLADDPLAQMREPVKKLVQAPPHQEDVRARWLAELQPLTAELERRGLSWGWVNAHAIDSELLDSGQLTASGGRYQSILFANVEAMEDSTLARVGELSAQGTQILFFGRLPSRQPGFKDAERGDAQVRQRVTNLFATGQARLMDNPETVVTRVASRTVAPLTQAPTAGIRSYARMLGHDEWIYFFANQSAQAETVSLTLPADTEAWWFDALQGTAWPVQPNNKQSQNQQLQLGLRGYSSRFLILGQPMPQNQQVHVAVEELTNRGELLQVLDQWQLQVGDKTLELQTLQDWRNIPELTYSDAPGIYQHSFTLPETAATDSYLLDLGLVFGSAKVAVNGKAMARASIPPFVVDITSALQPGDNTIEVEVLPPLVNGFIAKARAQDPRYQHMARADGSAFGAGLPGPVRLFRTEVNQ
ncbi:hypothetical protein G8770_08740 [Aestuariicella hydrocarbonica]|uniref:Alpha-L-rhamnosidase n=1 Tax=Pseudomaricurvus hydrocarbonicus TaxID=1470433 RepID=A0A9E5JW51_9GAMM|nr:glycosyl hydrolase [Aestuariicella hydrocarbonica]NHO65625.1 hypothetical protein [Aestuariicella hydrocarbonica]